MRSLIKNKRGDIESILVIVIILFVVGVVFLLTNDLNHKLLTKEEAILNSSEHLNDSYAIDRIQTIRASDDRVWDYAFLALFFGSILALGLTSYATRFSPVFFWLYVIMGLVVLVVAVMLSNFWQSLATNPNMAEVITRFPITNFILGTYYPTIVTAILIFLLILIFGKAPGDTGEI